MARRDQFPGFPKHVPVDQVLLLSGRLHSRDRNSGGSGAVLITSEAGVAKFWDLFGHKAPLGMRISRMRVIFKLRIKNSTFNSLTKASSKLCMVTLGLLLALSMSDLPIAMSFQAKS